MVLEAFLIHHILVVSHPMRLVIRWTPHGVEVTIFSFFSFTFTFKCK